jgi:hypothetical protein
MVNKREIYIKGKLYEVEDIGKYAKNPDAYLSGYTAVDCGADYILPVISTTSNEPGICIRKNAPFNFARLPESEEELAQYHRSNIYDYSTASNYREFIDKQDMVRELEKDILTSPDSIYVPPTDPDDTPAMKALKEAVVKKHIDLDKYEPRFGQNYNNDKRIFNKTSISLPMLVRMCNALDIKATLILEDRENVVNPINDVITTEITSSQTRDEDE